MKTLLLILFVYIVAYPQWKSEKIMDISSYQKIYDISTKQLALISEIKTGQKNYYLINLDKPSIKEFLISNNNIYENDVVKFSQNERYIIFRKTENKRWKVIFYDINNKRLMEINKPEGDVLSASIINEEKILFRFKKPNELSKIYLLNRKINLEKFITIGIGEQWSPDGNYFFVKEVNQNPRTKENKKQGKFILYRKSIFIFNSNGEKVLSISDLSNISKATWSPDSKKILINSSQPGFSIIYLQENSNTLTYSKIDYLNKLNFNEGRYIGIVNPVWSPDSKYIYYLRTIEDGHKIYETAIWALELKNNNNSLVYNSNSDYPFINKIFVNDSYDVITVRGKSLGSSKIIIKINTGIRKEDK